MYEALRASPTWNKTLFLITYDEHGGFYDHVPPPSKGVPSPDGIRAPNGFDFDRLGVRVPTLAISPWIPAGTLISQPFPMEQPTPYSAFDSTSIMATAHALLGLRDAGAPMLGERTAWANTFVGLLHLRPHSSGPRTDCPETLPQLAEQLDLEGAVAEQRAKPINEHIHAQLLFFCAENFGNVDETCEGHPSRMANQGEASDWILDQSDMFWERRGRLTIRRQATSF